MSEIEITDEMIAAGADVLRTSAEECFNYLTTKAEEVAEEVFLAMISAKGSKKNDDA